MMSDQKSLTTTEIDEGFALLGLSSEEARQRLQLLVPTKIEAKPKVSSRTAFDSSEGEAEADGELAPNPA